MSLFVQSCSVLITNRVKYIRMNIKPHSNTEREIHWFLHNNLRIFVSKSLSLCFFHELLDESCKIQQKTGDQTKLPKNKTIYCKVSGIFNQILRSYKLILIFTKSFTFIISIGSEDVVYPHIKGVLYRVS